MIHLVVGIVFTFVFIFSLILMIKKNAIAEAVDKIRYGRGFKERIFEGYIWILFMCGYFLGFPLVMVILCILLGSGIVGGS